MELNIKKAFYSPFSDEKWYLKLIFPSIMAIFSLISNIAMHQHNNMAAIVSYLISFLPCLVLGGFFLQFAHNEIHDELPLLPNLKSKILQYFKYGLSIFGLALIYAIAFFVIAFVISFISGFVLGVLFGILKFNKILLPILLTIIFIPILLLVVSFMILLSGKYADNFNFKEALDYKKIWTLLSKTKSEIIIYILLIICLIILFLTFTIISSIIKFTLLLVPILIAILQLISMNLKAQIYKIAKSRLENIDEIKTQDA